MSNITYEKALTIVSKFIDSNLDKLQSTGLDYERGQVHGLQTVRNFIDGIHDMVVEEESFDISLCEACKNHRGCQLYCEGRNFEPRTFKMFIHNIKMDIIKKWRENRGKNR